ncbi:MAG TPA: hypothetical protein VGI45_22105 [Terracidiphilus sp.]
MFKDVGSSIASDIRVPYSESAKGRTAEAGAFIALAFTRECHVAKEDFTIFSLLVKAAQYPGEHAIAGSRVDAIWGVASSA